MRKINSELTVFYETAHAELASALEMLMAFNVSASSKLAMVYSMHAKDEYNHAKSFFKMLSSIGNRASIDTARDFRLTAPSLNLYFF